MTSFVVCFSSSALCLPQSKFNKQSHRREICESEKVDFVQRSREERERERRETGREAGREAVTTDCLRISES